jgi:GNAT superfamily N-acetyltransferase
MLEFRQIRSSDFKQVSDIFQSAFSVQPPQPIEYFANLCHSDPESCQIGLLDGEPVGYSCGHRSGRIGYIGTIAVLEEHRGHGFGKQLTAATRDLLAPHCDVVGISVDPHIGPNIELYTSCGFEPSMPSCTLWRQWTANEVPAAPSAVCTACELGSATSAVLQEIRNWMDEVFPGLDYSRDLELFAAKYPKQLWFHFEDGVARGFLAYEPLFRGDVWGAVRPGPGEHEALDDLVCAIESSLPERNLWLHFHTNFQGILPTLRKRGYRTQSHNTNLTWSAQAGLWPLRSDAILIRPWWT